MKCTTLNNKKKQNVVSCIEMFAQIKGFTLLILFWMLHYNSFLFMCIDTCIRSEEGEGYKHIARGE